MKNIVKNQQQLAEDLFKDFYIKNKITKYVLTKFNKFGQIKKSNRNKIND